MDAISRPGTTEDLARLAMLLDRHGVAGLRSRDLDRVARAAARAGVPTPIVDALLDPSVAEVVRLRAFGRIHAQVAADPRPEVTLAA